MQPAPEIDEAEEVPTLLADLQRLAGTACARCEKSICGHEVLFSVAMGAKDAPRCLSCLAKALDRTGAELRDDLTDHFQRRKCYGRAWAVACEREGQANTFRPTCLGVEEAAPHRREIEAPPTGATVTDAWDAGGMSCGDLVLALRIRLNALAAGSVLQVTATDPAAPLDLPAWCRLTGHRLLEASHPKYVIQRKER